MDHFDEKPIDFCDEHMPQYPAAYFNNMCNRELYGWVMFERRGEILVSDPENLSEEFRARARAINIDDLPAGNPTEWVLPKYDLEAERLKDVVKEQLDCYRELEEDGHPPWYHSSQIQHVVYNAKDLPGITEPWRGKYDDGSRVLSKQLLLWKKFRRWQEWRRERADHVDLGRESLGRLVKLGVGHLSEFALEPDEFEQDEATTLLEYLDFIDLYYAPNRALLQSCQGAHDENRAKWKAFEQKYFQKRARKYMVTRRGHAAGNNSHVGGAAETPTGRALMERYKEGVANLENAKRIYGLRHAIWDRTVAELTRRGRREPDAVDGPYPEAPLISRDSMTEIKTKGAGEAVLQTYLGEDQDEEVVDYRSRNQWTWQGPRRSRIDQGPAYSPGHLRLSAGNSVVNSLAKGLKLGRRG
ncbi:hypothetical protein J3458_009252 [Metarhizium acridum]|uniref:uncharacterized protein n=1 Tax=Metarhizium acridum TaxID=92637 RepID=UPI001C6C2CAD|nr:hypothetical protein J3458_009252 [Metarhizium acridum]